MSNTVIDDDARLDALEEDLNRYRVSRDGWTVLVLAFAVFAALVSIVGIGLALRAADDEGGAAAGEAVEADLSEFAIDLSVSSIATPGSLTVRNNGTMVHNLAVRGTDIASADMAAGESSELDISALEPGTYEIICTIPGHTESGMSAELVVGEESTAGGGGATAAAGAGHGSSGSTTEISSMVAAAQPAKIGAASSARSLSGVKSTGTTMCSIMRSAWADRRPWARGARHERGDVRPRSAPTNPRRWTA